MSQLDQRQIDDITRAHDYTLESVRNARLSLAAYHQFRNEVGALMLRLLEERDRTGLVLLELVRDLDARTGELYLEENQ